VREREQVVARSTHQKKNGMAALVAKNKTHGQPWLPKICPIPFLDQFVKKKCFYFY